MLQLACTSMHVSLAAAAADHLTWPCTRDLHIILSFFMYSAVLSLPLNKSQSGRCQSQAASAGAVADKDSFRFPLYI